VELPNHQKGLIVLSVGENGPAAKAGVLLGDILVSLDGTSVSDTDDIQRILEARAIGQSVEAVAIRGGEQRKIVVTIGERPRGD
jgi:S1-C subfamily serine protease